MIEYAVRQLRLLDKPLAYIAEIAGKPFLRQWTLVSPREGATPEIRFMAELDPGALGLGGSVKTTRAILRVDKNGYPIFYLSEDYERKLQIDFGEMTRATLPDGSVQTIDTGPVHAVIENNYPGQSALFLAICAARGQSLANLRITLFLATTLVAVDYRLEPIGSDNGLVVRSSLHEEIELDPDRCMLGLKMPSAGVTVRAAEVAAPDWDDFLRPPKRKLTYVSAANAGFATESIRIDGPVSQIGASLTRPAKPTGIGALLIQGSGNVDRDGFAGEIDTGLHEIADHLSEQGITTLRYDKRGVGETKYGADSLNLGFDVQIDEAEVCLEALARCDLVDTDRLLIIGHSMGGLIGLSLSVERRAGNLPCALLACPGRAIGELIEEQIVTRAELLGFDKETTARQQSDLREFFDFASCAESDTSVAPAHLQAGATQRRFISELAKRVPTELVRQQKAPILICNGTLDVQVSADRDARSLYQAARGNAGAELCIFEGLDHLFKATTASEGIAVYYRDRRVDKGFLDVLTGWVLRMSSAAIQKPQRSKD